MPHAFAYDAFISYAREDLAWAELVHNALVAKGFKVFLDRERLVAGVDWTDQLQNALEHAQHLIVLWSEAARASDWAQEERHAFRADLRHSGGEIPRHIIPVFLEGDNKPLAQFERIDVVKDAGAYAGGVQTLDPAVRGALVEKLEASIRHADRTHPIPLLVVTARRAELEAVDPDAKVLPEPLRSESLNSLIDRLGLGSRAALLGNYGDERDQWRPFGSDDSIRKILDELRGDINKRLVTEKMQPFRWQPLDQFWAIPPGQAAERLKREPVVVVLDPLALYAPFVRTLTTNHLVPAIRENARAVVTVLPPYALPPSAGVLRESIQGLATEIFASFYDPPVAARLTPRYVAGVGDVMDLKASLLTGIGAAVATGGTQGNVFTQT